MPIVALDALDSPPSEGTMTSGTVLYDLPMSKVPELLPNVLSVGNLKHEQPLAVATMNVTARGSFRAVFL